MLADRSPSRFEDIHKGNAMLLLGNSFLGSHASGAEERFQGVRCGFAARLNVITLFA
jgi:hypothetical protein